MRLILATYDALRSFSRPATRAEIERESGLDGAAVHKGLQGLVRRACLVFDGAPGALSTYCLKPGTARPTDLRGQRRKAHAVPTKGEAP